MTGRFFNNGSMVLSIYPDGSGEVRAMFQYDSDADAFCAAPRDKGGPMYVRVNTYDASFRAFPPEPITAD